jgi:hypothetical protein
MLFRTDIEPMCAYCRHSDKINDRQVVCPKKGVMSDYASCVHFTYDPLKRIPETDPAPDFAGYDEGDFEL